LGREGGHTENRIVHHKDITGFEIERALIEKASHRRILKFGSSLRHRFAYTTPCSGKEWDFENIPCYGAYILDEKNKKIK
jgi:L-aspartate oxidase